MLIYAGIDEAGYGPLLGPLCIAATVWEVDSTAASTDAPDLWALLRAAVCKRPTDRKSRVAIADSKKLKPPKEEDGALDQQLRHFERSVLACLQAASPTLSLATDSDLLAHLGAAPPAGTPWYEGSSPIPCCHDAAAVRIAANMLTQAMSAKSVRLNACRCIAIDAAELNSAHQQVGNKAAISGHAVWTLICSIVATHGSRVSHIRLALDRQGGRIRYMSDIRNNLPDWSIQVLQEDESGSRYLLRATLNGAPRTISLTFESRSEERHLPIALASMVAKYTRELWMARMNSFFGARIPGLVPTAGYVKDGRRFVSEIEPELARLGTARDTLIRSV